MICAGSSRTRKSLQVLHEAFGVRVNCYFVKVTSDVSCGLGEVMMSKGAHGNYLSSVLPNYVLTL